MYSLSGKKKIVKSKINLHTNEDIETIPDMDHKISHKFKVLSGISTIDYKTLPNQFQILENIKR